MNHTKVEIRTSHDGLRGWEELVIPHGRRGLSMDVSKCRAVLKHLRDIERFVKERSYGHTISVEDAQR